MSFNYKYARPALAVDCVVFGLDQDQYQWSVLLIERASPPFQKAWALPGGFAEIDETLLHAARRELQEETGVTNLNSEQLSIFDAVDRDPRERVISVAYYGIVQQCDHRPQAASDARSVEWHSVKDLPELAFDHRQIIDMAFRRLQANNQLETSGG